MVKEKNKKVKLGKSTTKELESCRPSTVRPLEDIIVDIRAIKKLIFGLPQGLGEPSTRSHSYVFAKIVRSIGRSSRSRSP